MNTAACKSTISFIDGDKGILRYRGYPIEQLAERSNYTEVCSCTQTLLAMVYLTGTLVNVLVVRVAVRGSDKKKVHMVYVYILFLWH